MSNATMAPRALLVTQATYDALREELEALRATGIAADPAEAGGARAVELDLLLRRVVVAHPEGDEFLLAAIGTVVEIEDEVTGRRRAYRLVLDAAAAAPGTDGALPVSSDAPVGAALLGARSGETVVAELPDGRERRLRIVRIRAAA